MLTLNDGRSELWQWDTGRKLTVDTDCSQVHFSNKVFGRSIDVDVIDGSAIIPDILLQTDKDLSVWAFVGTPENGYTKISKTLKVNRRNKPADYVFTPPEQTTLGEILKRLDKIEESQDPDAIKNAVDDYLANNPIKVNETDPTVPDWAKKKEKPKYTADDVGALSKTKQELTDEQQTQARENIGIEDLLTEEITGASGINLNDGVYEIGRFSTSGTEYDNEGNFAFRNVNYLPVEGGRTIVVYFDAAEWNGNRINWGVELVQYDSSGAVIENKRHYIENYLNNSESSFTLDANAALIRIHYNRNGELVFEDMTAPKIAIYYLEDAVQEFVEYGAGAETVLMVRKDRVQGLVALAGKKIIYDGDSICAGSAANAGGGYARIIADLTGSEYVNYAVGGGRLCSGVADRHCVADNLQSLATDGDIYCFQGGINDYWGNAVLGTYTPGDYTGAVDATTVCGALETIFRYALNNFPGKRVCFVITHKVQNTAYQKNGAGNTFKDYRDAMAGICQKYSVPFYDAFSESGLNGWNDAQNNLYLTGNANGTPDGCHPNEEGYQRFYVNQLIDLFESGRSSGSAEKGEPGKDGDDYVLTSDDKEEIAELAAELVEVPESSGGGGGSGETWTKFLTMVTEEDLATIEINRDDNGDTFAYDEIRVFARFLATTQNTKEGEVELSCYVNNQRNNQHYIQLPYAKRVNGTYEHYIRLEVSDMPDGFASVAMETAVGVGKAGGARTNGKLTAIRFWAQYIGAGTTFVCYGKNRS